MSNSIIHVRAQERPSSTAVIHDGEEVTYAKFANVIDAAVDYLKHQELTAGGTVVILARNLVENWIAILALQSLGLNTICINSTETLKQLRLDDATALLTSEADLEKHQLTVETATPGKLVIMPGPGDYNPGDKQSTTDHGKQADAGGHILYTSGSTGSYKKLFLSAELQQQRNRERIEEVLYNSDTVYYCADFGAWTGAGYKFPQAIWQAGGCVVYDQRPDWYQHFNEHKLTHAILLPPMLDELLVHLGALQDIQPPRDFYLMVGGGFLSRRSAEAALSLVTRNLNNVLSCTEINLPVMASKVEQLDDLHWLLPNPGRDVQIVDDSGITCPPGTEGQLRIATTELDYSPYVGEPAKSAEVFRNGYFYPGDMAVQRTDGRLRILGRSTDVINMGGQKHAAAPMEETIQNQMGLSAVCLFSGMNHAGEEELVVAFETDSQPDTSYLDWIGNEFRQFDRIRFATLHPFPRTSTGTRKIDRVALRKLLFSRLG